MIDVSQYQAWVGSTETAEDIVTPHVVRGMRALLDHEAVAAEGEELPPAWHWLFTNPAAPQSKLGPDGHPERGGFLPPVALPRRMWAGSNVEFHAPIRVGDRLQRVSRVESVTAKAGSTGALVFVIVRHEITSVSGGRTVDTQRIVYREAAAGGNAAPAKQEPVPKAGEFSRTTKPDEVLLFRFSALTFNGHRIHYDHPYTTQVEGYPGLVVHGPLVALAMLDCLHGMLPQARVKTFEFTPRRPLTLAVGAMTAHARREGGGYALWMEAGGAVGSVGSATLA